MYVCNVGDSRIILKLREKVIPLSLDHKPDLEKEADRIIGLKGLIDY